MSVLILVAGIILFQLLIILHEYGHYLVARRNGVKVEEFGLGFPPRIFGKVMGRGIWRCYYTLNWLPLGGFVKLKGENDEAKGPGTYGGQNLWVKTKIILAGILTNFFLAVFLFTILALIGIPRLLSEDQSQFTISSDTTVIESKTIISSVLANSPADRLGLKVGDTLLSVEGQTLDSNQLEPHLATLAGQVVSIKIERDDQIMTDQVLLQDIDPAALKAHQDCLTRQTDCPAAPTYLGIGVVDFVLQRSTWSAPLVGLGLSAQYSKLILTSLKDLVVSLVSGQTETAKEQVGGPIRIVSVLNKGSNYGFRFILMIIAVLSLTLAIMNALPIPALDGGRLALAVFFRKILRRPLTKKIEDRLVLGSFLVLLGLMVLVSILDIGRLL